MERPSKKPRLSPIDTPAPSIYDDFDLQAARARNDQRLKSIFESIFEKYGRDFSDVGDEIDLRTGEIVVNKGHLMGMQGEGDTEDLGDSSEDELQTALGDVVPGKDEGNGPRSTSDWEESREESPSEQVTDFSGLQFPPPRQPSTTLSDKPVDPLWQVPEIDDAKFYTPQPQRRCQTESSPHIAQVRSASPLRKKTASSIWAVRPRGRPRKNDLSIPKRKSSTKRKVKPLKPPSMRDWDFAQVHDDSSDSDDPLQEGTPKSSAVKSVSTIRSVERVSPTPKTPGVMNRGLFAMRRDDEQGAIKTPSVSSSSASSSPVHEISPTVRRQSSQEPDVPLTFDDGRLSAESQDEWEDEETVAARQNWEDSQPDDKSDDGEWFHYVRKTMDKSGIRQGTPSWIKEIKSPMAGSVTNPRESTDDSAPEDSVFDDGSTQRADSDKDPTPGTDVLLSPKGFEEILSRDFDDGPGSGISSIQLNPVPRKNAAGSQKTTPIKAKSPYRKNARLNYY
ncbi:hypothetical protein VTN31DRAFT_3578 [Thermomyces dupontii]|uniref:uncharacterized protein n=1 Tax=Talaromyces thermophilus TaxID=28565 RepID=UPI0037437132